MTPEIELRDYFAGLAMQALISSMMARQPLMIDPKELLELAEMVPKNAYFYANEMIVNREKTRRND